jgi:hypothetical protein
MRARLFPSEPVNFGTDAVTDATAVFRETAGCDGIGEFEGSGVAGSGRVPRTVGGGMVDCRGVGECDGSGLAVSVRLWEEVNEAIGRGGTLVFVGWGEGRTVRVIEGVFEGTFVRSGADTVFSSHLGTERSMPSVNANYRIEEWPKVRRLRNADSGMSFAGADPFSVTQGPAASNAYRSAKRSPLPSPAREFACAVWRTESLGDGPFGGIDWLSRSRK